ncbi:MAG TPA: DUF697 domain-containing protein [Burkholderiales bacterium]|nr:DUF697 domain-containing protein [Burkholderiales bacterium]
MSTTEVICLPRSHAELDEVVRRCRKMVTRRALASAGAVLVPLPGVDLAADVALLTQLIPAVNREFGLTPDQIEDLSPRLRVLVYKAIVGFGGAMVGRLITRDLVLQALTAVGMRVTTKTAAKLVPVAGQAISAGLSFTAMRIVGESHIRDCRQVIEEVLADRGVEMPPPPARPTAAQRLRAAAARAAGRLKRTPRA